MIGVGDLAIVEMGAILGAIGLGGVVGAVGIIKMQPEKERVLAIFLEPRDGAGNAIRSAAVDQS